METLKSYIKQVRGITYRAGESINTQQDGYLPVLRSNNIKNGRLNFENLVYVPKEKIKDHQFLRKGDILITSSTGSLKVIGKNASVQEDYKGSFGAFCKVVRPSEKVSADYFKHFFQSYYYKTTIRNITNGANINNIKTEHIDNLKIPLPPLKTQQKIAAILDEADKLRQLNKKLIKKYEALSQSLYLEMFGDLVNNQKNWDLIPFGTVFNSIRYGTSSPPIYQKEGIPFIRATNVKKGTVEKKGMTYISGDEAKKIKKCKLNEGDLIIVRSGANTGDCCRIPKEYQNSYGGFDLIIEIKEPYSTFYNYLLNTIAGKTVLEPLTRRAGQPHLNSKQITELQLINPPISLQNQFAERVQEIDKQKIQVQHSLEQSENLFNSLLQKAFKGELV